MDIEPLDPEFPYRNYTDYIADLSAVDEQYTALYNRFSPRPIRRHVNVDMLNAEPHKHRGGSVVVLDSVGGRLDLRQYIVSKENVAEDVRPCIKDIEQDLPDSHMRVIVVNYYKRLLSAECSGLDVRILDAIGYKYKIHPEVYMWHFGPRKNIPHAKPPPPSALSTPGFFHIWNRHSVVSTHLHNTPGARRANAVIIFASDYHFSHTVPLLTSRINFLDSPIPMPRQKSHCWSNDLFLQYLQHMSTDEVAICDQNPVEYIIPFAQMSLVNGTSIMDEWDNGIVYTQSEGAINLEVRYDQQIWAVNKLRQNLQALETFTTDASSRRWKSLLPDYQRSLRDAEQQVIVLAQKMSYRASMASLRESQMAIKQNERVKQLTQLAFIFIPLSFVTSLFGMNVTALGTGSAMVWMVVVSIIITYVVIALFWIILHYQALIVNWTAKSRAAKWLQRVVRTMTQDDQSQDDQSQ